jgi:hypothetical protein
MAEVLVDYTDEIVDQEGARYHARIVGAEMFGGLWQGWIEFVPLDGAPTIETGRETTQPNYGDARHWAGSLTAVYLEGALQRALHSHIAGRRHSNASTARMSAPRANWDSGAAQPVTALLNPFSAYDKGETLLRQQLGALASWHLVNIIEAYQLSSETLAVLNRLPVSSLVEIIVAAVATRRSLPA